MTAHEIAAALAAPFDPKEVKFKPQMVKNNRCLAMAYIDARLVQDRLDDVLGVDGWQDLYDLVPDGSVVCRLRVRFGEKWVTKTDVGSTSEQPDAGDRLKAAFSDALKRAAVKYGIGRYLYRLPAQWVDYDPVKKQIVQVPHLPPFAIPKGVAQKPQAAPQQAAAPVAPATQAPVLESVVLTRTFLDRFGKVKSRDEVTNLEIEVGQAKKDGKLTEPQCNTIRLAAEGARKSFPVPAKT